MQNVSLGWLIIALYFVAAVFGGIATSSVLVALAILAGLLGLTLATILIARMSLRKVR